MTEHRMTPRQKMRKVLELRYFHNMTLEEVGDLMGITRERVRQIEQKALRILRANHDIREAVLPLLAELDESRNRYGD